MLPCDVLVYLCGYLDTPDIARLGAVIRLPDESWTASVRRRCGAAWPCGRAGIMQLHRAVHGFPNCVNTGAMMLSHCADAVCAVTSTAIEVWGSSGHRRLGRDCGIVYCLALVNESMVAIGSGTGLMLHRIDGPCTQAWFTPYEAVVSVGAMACGNQIVFSTAQNRAYTYTLSTGSVAPLYPGLTVFCVSAPPLLVGTAFGTYPVTSIFVPCTLIRHSRVLACAWHTDGHIVTFDCRTLAKRHMFDTGPGVSCVFSVIGDLVCMRHTVWRNGQRYCTYPCFPRAASDNGQHIVTGFT